MILQVELFYEETRWDDFSSGKTLNVNTYPGHVWNVRLNNKLVHTWVINEDLLQSYEFDSSML